MLCKVGSLSPLRGFCFVVSMSGGCAPVCNLDNPSDFPTAGMLYVRAGLQFATVLT